MRVAFLKAALVSFFTRNEVTKAASGTLNEHLEVSPADVGLVRAT